MVLSRILYDTITSLLPLSKEQETFSHSKPAKNTKQNLNAIVRRDGITDKASPLTTRNREPAKGRDWTMTTKKSALLSRPTSTRLPLEQGHEGGEEPF